jgi:hypothetical protein
MQVYTVCRVCRKARLATEICKSLSCAAAGKVEKKEKKVAPQKGAPVFYYIASHKAELFPQ